MSAGDDARPESEPGRCAIGIDVGGTKIAAGVVAETGRILHRHVVPTRPGRGGEAVLLDVFALARDLQDRALESGDSPAAIGLGLCELVDPGGEIRSDQTVRWLGLPVAERLSELLPTFLEADVRAAALCESRLGSGRELRTFLYVSIGTGISSCLVIDGAPYLGAQGRTGTMATGASSFLCKPCGELRSMVLEEIASGPALVTRYNERAGSSLERAEGVVDAAQRGDRDALFVVETAAEMLGAALGLLINVLDPHGIVTGGGLGSAESVYGQLLEPAVRRHIWSADQRALPIARAAFGKDAGIVGAAFHALERSRGGSDRG